jgi:hypothetical protein
MVVGFNHNIGYKGEIFHVQTEDSGRSNPHVITLLYRGGTILGSAKTSYADILTTDQLELVVESIMKEQHKEMMRRLKNGEFDSRIFGTTSAPPASASETVAPAAPPAPAEPAAAEKSAPAAPAAAERSAPVAPVPAAPAPAENSAAAATPAAAPKAAPVQKSETPRQEATPAPPAAASIEVKEHPAPAPKVMPAPVTGAAPASATRRSLDEVILDYLITGEE